MDNQLYPVTLELAQKIFATYGQVLRIAVFDKPLLKTTAILVQLERGLAAHVRRMLDG